MRSVRGLLAAVILTLLVAGTVFLAGGAAVAEQRLGTPYPDLWQVQETDGTCPAPPGWVPYRVKQAETMASLAGIVGVSEEELRRNNCIEGELNVGETLFLPVVDLAPSPSACGPPPGWKLRTIEAGVTVADIAQQYGIREEVLRRANCLEVVAQVETGLRIYLPATPAASDTEVEPSATPQAQDTEEPTATFEG